MYFSRGSFYDVGDEPDFPFATVLQVLTNQEGIVQNEFLARFLIKSDLA